MNVNDIFPSKYLKAHDLGGKSYTLTIARVTLETVGFGQQEERKLAIAFEKATKLMLLNRTNAMIIASLFGPETDMWIGKAITIYSARVKAFGTWHDALRVKEQIPAKTIQNPPPTDAMVEAPAMTYGTPAHRLPLSRKTRNSRRRNCSGSTSWATMSTANSGMRCAPNWCRR
jgi:hypothetical protein